MAPALIIPLATLAISAAATGYSIYSGMQQGKAAQSAYDQQVQTAQQQATAEQDYQEALVADNELQQQENESRAIRHFNYQNLSEDLRLQQIREILAEDTTDLRRQGLRARGHEEAAQSTRGTTGQSAELVLQDIRAQEAAQRVRLEQQYTYEQQGASQRKQGFAIELDQNKAAIPNYIPGPIHVNRPIAPNLSPLQQGLMSGLGTGLSAVGQYGLPTLQAYLNTQTPQTTMTPSFQSTQSTFSNPNFGGLASS